MILLVMSAAASQAQTLNGILKADPEELTFGTTVGDTQTKVVTISVLDIDGLSRILSPLITAEIIGTDSNQFSIDSNNIDLLDIIQSLLQNKPIDIEVTYNPTKFGTSYATLKIALFSILGIQVGLLNIDLQGIALEE